VEGINMEYGAKSVKAQRMRKIQKRKLVALNHQEERKNALLTERRLNSWDELIKSVSELEKAFKNLGSFLINIFVPNPQKTKSFIEIKGINPYLKWGKGI